MGSSLGPGPPNGCVRLSSGGITNPRGDPCAVSTVRSCGVCPCETWSPLARSMLAARAPGSLTLSPALCHREGGRGVCTCEVALLCPADAERLPWRFPSARINILPPQRRDFSPGSIQPSAACVPVCTAGLCVLRGLCTACRSERGVCSQFPGPAVPHRNHSKWKWSVPRLAHLTPLIQVGVTEYC